MHVQAVIGVFLIILILLVVIRHSVKERFSQKPNLVIITSVIHTIDAPLSYGKRSLMTHDQRFQQTRYSISSVRERIPNPYVVLIEGSDITEEEAAEFMQMGCDQIHMVSDSVRKFINGPHKSVGEVKMLMDYLTTVDPDDYETISKISGRYYLTDNFDWDRKPIDAPLYSCEFNTHYNKEGEMLYNTRYYRFPMSDFHKYLNVLHSTLEDPEFVNGIMDVEHYNIFKTFRDDNKTMKPELIGVRGYVAPFGFEVED